MKKFLSLILSVFVFSLSLPHVVCAGFEKQGYCGDPSKNGGKNVVWELTQNAQDSTMYDLTIKPADGTTGGAMRSFHGKSYNENFFLPREYEINIKSVVIENNVTSIGEETFVYFSNLTSISISNSVTSIGDGAFFGCTSLEFVKIPSSVKSIGVATFRQSSLKHIEIPNSVQSIERLAFMDCTNLDHIKIPSSVESIGQDAFSGCYGLTTIKIPCNFDKSIFTAYSSGINLQDDDTYTVSKGYCIGASPTSGTFEYVHNLNDVDNKEPTCTEPGTVTKACKNCTYSETQTLKELGHDMGEWKTTKEPTCTELGTQTKSCKNCTYSETQTLPVLGHDYGIQVVAPTETTLGGTLHKCSRCGDKYWSDFTKDETYAQTLMPSGEKIYDYCNNNGLAAETTVDIGDGKTIQVFLYDPLGVLKTKDTDDLGINVTYVPEDSTYYKDLRSNVDDKYPIEHIKFFNVNPTVNGDVVTGELDKSVCMLYEIPEGLDANELEMILVKKGLDQDFNEIVIEIGNKKYLLLWKNHFSPYAMIDKLSEEEQAALNVDKLNDEQKAQLNAAIGSLSDEELAQLKEEIDSSSNQVKTGDEAGYILLMSSSMLLIAGLYLEICLINRKINII